MGMHGHVMPEVDRPSWVALAPRWATRTVVVVGDAMLDRWCYGSTERVCREAPAPVLQVRRQVDAPGGAANVAVNVAALGARAVLVSLVGADGPGERLRRGLAEAGVVDRTVPVPGRATAVKRRLLADDQVLLREDHGTAPVPVPAAAASRLTERLRATLAGVDEPILLVSDYGLGGVPEPVRRWLLVHRWRFATVGLDARDLRPWRGLRPTILTPSLPEAVRALDDAAGTHAAEHARALRRRHDATAVAVTLGRDGAVLVWQGGERRTHAHAAPDSHSVGAGDVYLAAATLAWASGVAPDEVAVAAQQAAQSALSGPGTCRCDPTAWAAPPGRGDGGRKVVARAELADRVRRCRESGGRIVFTNGCFDAVHSGHVRHLEQARRLGDLLVVAVNGDRSVRRRRGPGRPVHPVAERVAALAELAPVDLVAVFDDETAAALVEAVRPDVYVKGADHTPDALPEATLVRRLGGVVVTLPYVPDHTAIAPGGAATDARPPVEPVGAAREPAD